jgi:DNA-binding MarR family transcriptional regulator
MIAGHSRRNTVKRRPHRADARRTVVPRTPAGRRVAAEAAR